MATNIIELTDFDCGLGLAIADFCTGFRGVDCAWRTICYYVWAHVRSESR